MHPKYPHVFSPISLGPVEIPNRFYFAPHGVGLAVGSEPSNDFPYYTAERVKGGCGLVINSLPVQPKVSGIATPYPEANIPSFQAMAEAVHREGGKIFGELWYWWCNGGQWAPMSPPAPALSPSAVQMGNGYPSTHAMSRDELRSTVSAHRQSASHLRRAGYDGVEIHVSHGILLEQFISPYFNRRTDEYGGSVENRLRYLYECLEATREGAGNGMAVGIRYNCDEMLPGGYDQAQATEMLERICKSGLVDFVDLDVAVEPNQLHLGMPSVFVEPHIYKPYVHAMRKVTGEIPVLSVLGRLTSVADGEAAIAAGVCDMVGAARGLIAEPELVKHAREGNEDRSRTCIACNWCTESAIWGATGCAINPASYRERHWGVDTFEDGGLRRSKVVVVGAGPGGVEAARVAAKRGHDVILLEARPTLGGGLRVWSSLPDRGFYTKGIDWYERELDRLGVEVRLSTEATAASILAEHPDAVIVATGATYSKTGRSGFREADIAGWDRDFVLRPEDVLIGGARPTGKIILLDAEGLHASVGIAEILAVAGAQVEYVTASFAPVAPSLMASLEVGFVVGRLKAAGVTLSTSTYLREIGDHSVVLYDVFTDADRTVSEVDAVILVTSRQPNDALSQELEGKVTQLFTIGDALAARPMAAANYEGHKFARFIGDPEAPTTFDEAYWQPVPAEVVPQPAATLLRSPLGAAV